MRAHIYSMAERGQYQVCVNDFLGTGILKGRKLSEIARSKCAVIFV